MESDLKYLSAAIHSKLNELLGNRSDDVLVEYIFILLANGKSETGIATDLVAFLGDSKARNFTGWLMSLVKTFSISDIIKQRNNTTSSASSESATVNTHENEDGSTSRPSNQQPQIVRRKMQLQSEIGTVIQTDINSMSKSKNNGRPTRSFLRSETMGNLDHHPLLASSSSAPAAPIQIQTRKSVFSRLGGRVSVPYGDAGAMDMAMETETSTMLDGQDSLPVNVPIPVSSWQGGFGGGGSGGNIKYKRARYGVGEDEGDSDGEGDGGGESAKRPKHATHDDDYEISCKFFPKCKRGKNCWFEHPRLQCKFGIACTNSKCNFWHDSYAEESEEDDYESEMFVPACLYGASCFYKKSKGGCAFKHPIEPCKFGLKCTRPRGQCLFNHNPLCWNGGNCRTPMCKFSHFE